MTLKVAKIRPARSGDAHALSEVYAEAWRSTYQGVIPHLQLERLISRRGDGWWSRTIRRSKTSLYVFTYDGEIQGYVTFGAARSANGNRTGEIYELYLTPTYQGLGFGKELFSAAYDTLKKYGCRKLIVWALADNEIACAFYKRLGGKNRNAQSEDYGDTKLKRIAFVWDRMR